MNKLYLNKSDCARYFGISRSKVYRIEAGIIKQMKAGRYNQYAICDGLINVYAFADYLKYGKRLENPRNHIPEFNLADAKKMIGGV